MEHKRQMRVKNVVRIIIIFGFISCFLWPLPERAVNFLLAKVRQNQRPAKGNPLLVEGGIPKTKLLWKLQGLLHLPKTNVEGGYFILMHSLVRSSLRACCQPSRPQTAAQANFFISSSRFFGKGK
jgi:hypothetical protein